MRSADAAADARMLKSLNDHAKEPESTPDFFKVVEVDKGQRNEHGPKSSPPAYSPAVYGDDEHAAPSYPPPAYGTSSPPPTSSPAPETAPICNRSIGCIQVNATSGAVLDAFRVIAPGWESAMRNFPSLLFEFGVISALGPNVASAYQVRQPWSPAPDAVIVGLPVGHTLIFACARSANFNGKAVGPRSCAFTFVDVAAQASEQQVAEQLSDMETLAKQPKPADPAAARDKAQSMANRLKVVASVVNGNGNGAAVKSLASGLISDLLNASVSANDTASASVASVLSVFDSVGALWSMADANGRAAAVKGVSAFSKKLALQPLAAADAQPVIAFFSQMLEGAADIVSASAGNSTSGDAVAAAKKEVARSLLAAVTEAAAALTQGLLNAAPSDGSAVLLVTARLSAAVQRTTATLISAGVSVALAAPPSAPAARRQLLASAPSVSVSLSPSVGSLCAADTVCSAAGLGLTITVTSDTSLLATALGGSLAPLAATQLDYKVGGSVQVISPVVRVAAPGLPANALGLASLVVLDMPIDSAAVNASAKRLLVRLQDFGAAPTDSFSAVTNVTSVTRTLNSASSSAIDVVSGYSSELGDFVVVQYSTTAVPTAGGDSSSPSPSPSPLATPGAAGLARLPSALLTAAMAGVSALLLSLML
ncbi:hypothetical protein GPECTOR_15g522 [Gonium pectorale]|uniref:Uncharacterized protein n=1 Tax=Gonium pectorale TaxID=33097 RepID=A0A150GLU9_GONPE|nr:hypothetical protein GPECTOR_15g522 [Gonium pectorale]|eukprot:KXZ50836.1 hypothetical protein GPECTOR_15g522 [Gonium pectorale]